MADGPRKKRCNSCGAETVLPSCKHCGEYFCEEGCLDIDTCEQNLDGKTDFFGSRMHEPAPMKT